MSDAEGDVDKLFESSDEDQAEQPQRPQRAADDDNDDDDEGAAPNQLGDVQPDDSGAQAASPADDAGPSAEEPLTANRRFAEEEEEEEADAQGEAEQREAPPEVELGPPLELGAPLVRGPDFRSIRLVRASNILGVQSKPFSPDTHVFEPDEYEDAETGEMKVRLANSIRWRHTLQPDGTTKPESNARFVRWSDGSMQLLVGDEVLDVAETDVSGDHHFMFVRHTGFIQAQAQLATRMAFRPSSVKSSAHKRLAAVMDRRHGVKSARIQATTTMMDPAREKAQRAKMEEARIRDREGLQRRQEKEMRKYTRAPARSSAAAGGLSAAYLEAADEDVEEEEDDYGGLTASERARQSLARPRRDARDEEEAERRLASAKRGAPPGASPPAKRPRAAYDLDEDEDAEMRDFIVDEGEEEGDDDEEQAVGARKPAGRRRLALSDEDDE